MLPSPIIIVILAFISAVVTPVGSFMHGCRITLMPCTRYYRELSISPIKERDSTKVFNIAAGKRIRLHHSKRRHDLFETRQPTATMMVQSKEGQRHPIALSPSPPPSSSSSLSQLFSSSSSIESSPRRKTTVVYLLILVSVLSFVGDNIIHLPALQTLYLYHQRWSWWQPITSIFCHGDKSHLTGNIFLLLIFGRSVEDELGPVGLLFSYVFCGVMANCVSLAMLPKNTISLGASGAVFGLFSISIFSRLSWGDVLDWRKTIEVGVLGQFVVNKFFNEAKTAAAGGIIGVNHVAHLSGAGAGVAMILILRKLINMMEK